MRAALLAVALSAGACASLPAAPPADPLAPFVEVLRTEGREPAAYVAKRLADHDLLIFDDGIHSAAEPFDFYRRLLTDTAVVESLDVLFLELVPLNRQPALDAYLAAENDDPSLLWPAFQNDTGGLGLAYATYFELLRAVREANATRRRPGEPIRVVAVSNPTWWSEVRTPRDVELFRRGLLGRDYDMYRVILEEMQGFEAGLKGIFLTNTRHAYKDVRRADGTPFWNAGTFFHRWHPGKTWSLRIHNAQLFIEAELPAGEGVATTEGLGRYRYRWGRMADGLWDAAFAALGDRPLAIPLAGNAFGRTPYAGNHMHQTAPGQTMADAYDALIFLAPLDTYHQTALVGEIYTEEFRQEAARRFALLFPGEAGEAQLSAEGAATVEELLSAMAQGAPREPLSVVQDLGPIDAWRRTR